MKTRKTYTLFVSITLLLIVFFVWSTVVTEPNVLSVWGVQGYRKSIKSERPKRTLEILLVNKDTIQFCYFPTGSVCRANFIETDRHSMKLRETLLRHRKEALLSNDLTIVVFPLKESTFGCLADVVDEMHIAGNLPYTISY